MNKIPISVWIMGLLLVGAVAIIGFTMYTNSKVLSNITLPIEITEYFDYECPHCAEFHPVIKEAEAQYGDKIKVTYKNYPFLHEPSFPDDSTVFAYAAEAAGLQGKRIEYHDAIFDLYDKVLNGQAQYTDMDPVKIAQSLKLDITKFNKDRASQEIKDLVAADKNAGDAAGVTGTPTVFINGQIIEISEYDATTNSITYNKFKDTISRLVDIASKNTTQTTTSSN